MLVKTIQIFTKTKLRVKKNLQLQFKDILNQRFFFNSRNFLKFSLFNCYHFIEHSTQNNQTEAEATNNYYYFLSQNPYTAVIQLQ